MADFNVGDIIRYYPEGVSALFKYEEMHGDRLYGSHVLGGVHSSHSKPMFYTLAKADEKDIEFCKQHRPEWFK